MHPASKSGVFSSGGRNGSGLHAHAEASSDPQAIRAMVQHVYPRLPEARRDSFVQGKIGITITLDE